MKIADLLSLVRFYLDEESEVELPAGAVEHPYWNDTKLTLLINHSYAAFRDMLTMYDKDYGITTVTGVVTVPASTITLPTDLRSVNQLTVGGNVLYHRPLTLMLRNELDMAETGTPMFYCITGTTATLYPKATSALAYTLVYTPGITPAEYHALAYTLVYPPGIPPEEYHPPADEGETEVDYPERDTWLRWVVYDVVSEALKKDRRHDEAMAYLRYRQEVEAGIDRDISIMNRGTVRNIFGEA